MKQEVFERVRVQARDKPDARSVMKNDAAKIACLLLHAPVFFSLPRRRCETGKRARGEDSCPANKIVKLNALLEHAAGGDHYRLLY